MLTILMSNSEVFDKMYQEINRQNTFYFWIIGIVISMIPALVAIFFYFQWRLSDSQVKKMKAEIENNIVEKYGLVKLNKKVGDIVTDNAVLFYNRVEEAFADLDKVLTTGEYHNESAQSDATSIYNNMLYILSSTSIDGGLKQECFRKTKQHIKMLETKIEKLPNGSEKDKWKTLVNQIYGSLALLNENTQ